MPEHAVYGYYDGWPFEKLYSMFLYLQKAQLEERRQLALGVAVGAANVFSKGEALKGFSTAIDKSLDSLRGRTHRDAEDEMSAKIKKNLEVKRELQKLIPLLGR